MMNSLQTFCKNLSTSINNNADIVMAGGAIFGLGVSIYLSIKAAPRAEEVLYEANRRIEGAKQEALDKGWAKEELDATLLEIRIDTLKQLALIFGPAGVSILATSGCIIGSVSNGRSRNATLTTMLNASNLMHQEYVQHVRDEIGPKKEDKIYNDIREEHMKRIPEPSEYTIYNTGEGQTLCCIEFIPGLPETMYYFWSSPEAVHAAENDFQNLYNDLGQASLADLLWCLKIKERPKNAANIMWTKFPQFREGSHIHPTLKYPVLDISYGDIII